MSLKGQIQAVQTKNKSFKASSQQSNQFGASRMPDPFVQSNYGHMTPKPETDLNLQSKIRLFLSKLFLGFGKILTKAYSPIFRVLYAPMFSFLEFWFFLEVFNIFFPTCSYLVSFLWEVSDLVFLAIEAFTLISIFTECHMSYSVKMEIQLMVI